MNKEDRDRLRALQDRFLADPSVRRQVELFGEGHAIGAPNWPTFRDVREALLPDWEHWFNDFLKGD